MNKILTLLFIGLLNFTNHAFSDEKILSSLNEGKKLIFISRASKITLWIEKYL